MNHAHHFIIENNIGRCKHKGCNATKDFNKPERKLTRARKISLINFENLISEPYELSGNIKVDGNLW